MATTPEEIGQTLCREFDAFIENEPSTARWEELRQRLSAWFATVDESLALAGMLWVIENSHRYQHQLLAGELLLGSDTPLSIPSNEFISRIAPCLDASANTVIKYLKNKIGRDEALRQVHELRDSTDDLAMRRGLDTCRYWLDEHPGAG